MSSRPSRRYRCLFCNFEYDEALGLPEQGVAAGTRWEDLPEDWICPQCGAEKADYELLTDD
ncbi:MAG: rubredoxin [Pseudomonadales bacterium]|nr:rubredoxin [Pseudomonadales bacterium]MCP5182513.1 rubredoxin [Pseudomonadales bacterium]